MLVVGAGPAGAAAAITLARAGRNILVVDRATFPRDKCCGDGFTALALRELEALGFRPESVPDWQLVEDVWVRGPSGHTVKFPLPRGRGQYAVCAPRLQVDDALVGVVRASGAEVRDGHAITEARSTPDRVEVEVTGLGTVSARYVIGADGVWSPLRHALGAHEPGYLGDWHAFRQYFSGVSPTADALWVWFEEDLLPGYAWSFPLPGGRANVGFGIQRDAGVAVSDMKQMWPDILARPHIRAVLGDSAVPEGPHKAWPIPARVARMPLTAGGGRALFAGDAACATDPMTGEGIAQALVTGRQAAEAIVAGWASPRADAVATHYVKAVNREFFADHRFAATLSGALAHRKGVRIALRAAGATDWTRRNFARWLFEDYPRAILATPKRWHRGIFNQPGAYQEN